MKQYLLLFSAFLFSVATMAEDAPAFPGAEGHGRYVTGGRKADGSTTVVHVTNLNDSGTGSFRAAVTGGTYRTIVFDVAGVIALKSDVKFKDHITILGQTAPYPGITVRYYTVQPGADNIVRFIRFRRGQEKNVNDGADAIWQRNKTGIILDHCSFSWSIDEVASFYDNNNFTMQWCTIAESLTLRIIIDVGLHLKQIDNAFEIILFSDRKLGHNRILSELCADLLHGIEEIRTEDVHFVDKRHTGDIIGVRLSPDVF